MLGAIVRLTATVLCTAATGAGPICAGVASAFVAGVTSGDLGEALKAGLIATATAHAFTALGDMTGAFPGAPHGGHAPLDFGSPAHMFNMAGHAAVGCASTAVAGGRCGPVALSGPVGSFAGPLVEGRGFTFKLVATAAVGGAASVAGGGKFENGVVTAAYGYLFNAMAGKIAGQWVGGVTAGAAGSWTGPLDPLVIAAGRFLGGLAGSAIEDWVFSQSPEDERQSVPLNGT